MRFSQYIHFGTRARLMDAPFVFFYMAWPSGRVAVIVSNGLANRQVVSKGAGAQTIPNLNIWTRCRVSSETSADRCVA